MKQERTLSLAQRRKLAEELRQQYKRWGDEAIRCGKPILAKYYYRLAERCLYLIHNPHLEAMHGIATSPHPANGAFSSKRPYLRVIQGGKA